MPRQRQTAPAAGALDPSSDEAPLLLDEDDQDRLISELGDEEHQIQVRSAQGVFLGAVVLAVLYAVMLAHWVVWPLKHKGFRELAVVHLVPETWISVLLGVSIAAFAGMSASSWTTWTRLTAAAAPVSAATASSSLDATGNSLQMDSRVLSWLSAAAGCAWAAAIFLCSPMPLVRSGATAVLVAVPNLLFFAYDRHSKSSGKDLDSRLEELKGLRYRYKGI